MKKITRPKSIKKQFQINEGTFHSSPYLFIGYSFDEMCKTLELLHYSMEMMKQKNIGLSEESCNEPICYLMEKENREIKFRVFDPQSECMEEVGAIDWASDGLPITVNTPTRKLYRGGFKDDFILMQYTGLKDKNGREIYEGDIVQNNEGPNIYKFTVEFKDGIFGDVFKTTSQVDALRDLNPSRHLEVIGNIYENFELLK